ncbi:DUF1108 family protein [Staphylococcus simiae]|uniref:Phi PVL orf 39-like protein n=1 Tax=Staphylococcus simiae CCM 7213 = CCUG 51256 TaxID=911238 RepID=G5JH48_9STAP|nr:DUF1108 family protein [Staphylococcus simiae]EHJ08396.1 phi PVL orf 39-like protein [Staphylococcus simiae CCM 7213 = CCUG 51256]PNZ12644.1 DUF1108 domain-containing protein [Staphylococcus simiae]SNV66919.1 putative phi PVL-like protein [Staphylococcus simiae]
MYYKIGDVAQKVIRFEGFDFKLAVKKQDYGVLISILDLEGRYVAGMNIEEESDIYVATDNLQQAMREWIEENTDERDRLMNLVMEW